MSASIDRPALLRKRLERFTKTLLGVEHGDMRSLHRARVASRHLRELLPTLQTGPGAARKIGRRLRKITRHLGEVRELDVLALQLDELNNGRRDRASAIGRVGLAVARERGEAGKKLRARAPMDAMRRIARKLEVLAQQLEEAPASGARTAARSWRWVIDARVARRASRLLDAIHDAGAVYLPERLHAARIALKKLRYALELLTDATGKSQNAALRPLQRAQELLGRMHDTEVLIERVRQMQASLAPPNLGTWRDLDRLVASLEDECRRLHGRYMRQRAAIEAIALEWSGRDKTRTGGADSRSARAV
jgi:CHAD domain-containing protein